MPGAISFPQCTSNAEGRSLGPDPSMALRREDTQGLCGKQDSDVSPSKADFPTLPWMARLKSSPEIWLQENGHLFCIGLQIGSTFVPLKSLPEAPSIPTGPRPAPVPGQLGYRLSLTAGVQLAPAPALRHQALLACWIGLLSSARKCFWGQRFPHSSLIQSQER